MKKSCYILMLAGLSVITGNVLAADAEKSPWKSSVELGFIRTTGNTETQTLAVKADATYEVDRWRHIAHAEGYGQQSEDTTGNTVVSAERYEISGKSDYKFKERDYAFVLLKLKRDRFSGFEYEHILSLGYGKKVIKQLNMELDLEIGPGERFFKVDNVQAEEEALLRLAASYWWAISDTSRFTQELSTEIGENITSRESVTGIQANINSSLALKFTYAVRYKTKVPAGNERTDTEAAMTLVYNF